MRLSGKFFGTIPFPLQGLQDIYLHHNLLGFYTRY